MTFSVSEVKSWSCSSLFVGFTMRFSMHLVKAEVPTISIANEEWICEMVKRESSQVLLLFQWRDGYGPDTLKLCYRHKRIYQHVILHQV